VNEELAGNLTAAGRNVEKMQLKVEQAEQECLLSVSSLGFSLVNSLVEAMQLTC